jgi:hypothetical protein
LRGDLPDQRVESRKEKTDRQLIELLNELRVALPGAQILLGFLLTVPFATRFGLVDHSDKIVLFVCLVLTTCGTLLLMAPSVYHRLRWNKGGKSDVVEVAHTMFLAGTALLALGILAAIYLVVDVLLGPVVAGATGALIAVIVIATWYLAPLTRGRSTRIRRQE